MDKLKVWEVKNVFYIVLKLVLSWLRKKSHFLHLYIFKHLFTAWKSGRDRSPDMQNVQFRFPCVTLLRDLSSGYHRPTFEYLGPEGWRWQPPPLKNAVIYLAG